MSFHTPFHLLIFLHGIETCFSGIRVRLPPQASPLSLNDASLCSSQPVYRPWVIDAHGYMTATSVNLAFVVRVGQFDGADVVIIVDIGS